VTLPRRQNNRGFVIAETEGRDDTMTHRGPAKGYRTLAPEEESRRLELYRAGLHDGEIAARVGTLPQTILGWRRSRGLPPHPHTSCPMEQPLSPNECAEMQRFLAVLVALRRELPPGRTPDVALFMKRWRKGAGNFAGNSEGVI